MKKSGNKSVIKKITSLIEAMEDTPFEGIGKPEQLKHEFSGYWSRRINKEHRIVYQVLDDENKIVVLSLKGHYLQEPNLFSNKLYELLLQNLKLDKKIVPFI